MKTRNTDKRQLVTLYRSADGGLKYRGQVLNDLYDGWGEVRHKNGSRYSGYWSEGRKHGYGQSKNYVYEKEWVGKLYSTSPPSSDKNNRTLLRLERYAGNWRDGIKNGFGMIEIETYNPLERTLFPSQRISRRTIRETIFYEGCWKDGHYDGWGRLDKSNGYFYEGGWSSGQKNGQGLVVYPNGDCFEGNWCNDLREGDGKYWINKYKCHNPFTTKENVGRLISGVWKKDVMKSGVINGKVEVEDVRKQKT